MGLKTMLRLEEITDLLHDVYMDYETYDELSSNNVEYQLATEVRVLLSLLTKASCGNKAHLQNRDVIEKLISETYKAYCDEKASYRTFGLAAVAEKLITLIDKYNDS
jgi:hypothetical protein